MRHYVGFSQIGSHMVLCAKYATWATLHTVLLSIIIPLTLVPPLFHLFIRTNLCPSPRSSPCGPYTREFRGCYHSHSPHTTKPNWEYSNWYSAPTSSNFPCGKIWVRCIHQDGRPYPNLPRVRWHSTFKAETFCHQYQWMASSICSLCLSNCQEATELCSWPHGIPDSDSGSQQRMP